MVTTKSATSATWPKALVLRLRSSSLDAGLLITLLAMAAFFTLQSPYFLNLKNFLNIGRAVAIRGTVAAGLTMVMISGGLDLSIASVMAAAGMLTATLLRVGSPEIPALFGGVALGAVLGYVNGLFVTKIHVNPIIATLATMSGIRGLGYIFSAGESVTIPIGSLSYLGRGDLLGIPAPLFWFVLACGLVYFILQYTRLGHYAYAIGSNSDACRVSSVRVDFWRMLLYIICGTFAAFSGLMLMSMSGTATPTAAFGAELDILTAIILGGISLSGGSGTITGTVLGILILGTMTNGLILMGIRPYWQTVLRGVVLMIAVAVDSLRTGGYR
ncbi:MAG: ABC transporter permease [Anaerolineae bacterium]|jgi:ribose transport system permease protein